MKKIAVEELYEIFKQYLTVTTDSRNCPEESIFFALKGESFNGNTFAKTALEKGCRYAVIDEEKYLDGDNYILVDNCLETLQRLAKHHRKVLNTTIIGITGSNGKTTTKELIAAVLSQKFNTLFTQGNLNNHIGVPLTLLQLRKEHEIAVIEMGANHPGEIKTLAEIACPNFGIITNVGKAHLEGFGSFEGVVNTKTELYRYIKANKGKIFINTANSILTEKASLLEKIGYSLTETEGLVHGKIIANNPYISIEWQDDNTQTHKAETQLIGEYNAENVLAAICIGTYLGIEPEKICCAINHYLPQNHRSQLIKTERNDLIVDAYNANPTSMQAALKNFQNMALSPKVVILGDMLELGKNSQEEHAYIVKLLTEFNFEKVFLVGTNFSEVQHPFPCYKSVDELIPFLTENPLTSYTILIKGSRGTRLEKVIEQL